MNPRECPRCNQVRLAEWFGDPKAPYAICLSCRVEVNGEKKTAKQERRSLSFRPNCAICSQVLLGEPREICSQCEQGLRIFNNSYKMVARAASYLTGKLRHPRKQKQKKRKITNLKLQKLIGQQKADARDMRVRFEHAIYK